MTTMQTSAAGVKVADAVWIATALLHREQPNRRDFSLQEIVDRAQAEKALGEHKRATLYAHVTQHCVANVPPDSGKYRLLFETATGRRRLFIPGDPFDLRRVKGKTTPRRDDIPRPFVRLLDWYDSQHAAKRQSLVERIKNDPILKLRGLGKEIWAGMDADEYVRQLREE